MALKHVGKVTKIGAKRIGKVTYDRQKHRQNHGDPEKTVMLCAEIRKEMGWK